MKSRRNVTLAFATLALVLPVISGLLATGVAASPREEDRTVRVGNGDEPQGLDPHQVSGLPAARILETLFEGLVRMDPQSLEILPAAAIHWSVSDDGLVWTFRLHPEASWSDGRALTAEDFVFSFRRILNPNLGASYASNLFCIEGAEAVNRGGQPLDSLGVRAISPDQLEIRLAHPVPYFLQLIQHVAWYPVPHHILVRWGGTDTPDQEWTRPGRLVGNGPFILTDWRTNHYIRVEPNPRYRTGPAAVAPAIEFYPLQNFYSEERAFESGILQVTKNIPGERVQELLRAADPGLVVEPDFGVYYLALNTRIPPLDRPAFRRALALAIDRERIVRDIRQRGERIAAHLTPPVFDDYHPPQLFRFDPEAARDALRAAGYADPGAVPAFEYLFNTSETHRPIAEAIQSMWREVLGIEVSLVNRDWKAVLADRRAGNFAVLRSGWLGDYYDPVTFLGLYTTNATQNFGGWSDPEYDTAIRTAQTSGDRAIRLQALTTAETILLREAAVIPIFFYNRAYRIDPALKGWHGNVLNIGSWRTVHR